MPLRSVHKFVISLLPPRMRMSIRHYRRLGRWPNLDNPTSINEKILRRILLERDPNFSLFADKLAVRKYIEERLGAGLLVPLIANFGDAEELNELRDWNGIVIKPNHGAGMVKIIDKAPTPHEKKEAISLARAWLLRDYSAESDELHYSAIRPRLLVERKISDPGEDLRDYKFHRFRQADGSFVQVLQVVAERSCTGFETVFFSARDLDNVWHSPFGHRIELSGVEKAKIRNIMQMNETLCPEYSYVRLDWYITRSCIYFGEITFTPGGGLSRSFAGEFGEVMGKLWVT